MQAITQALREREASLLTLQALEDGRDKTQRGISMADENSSDRKRWVAGASGAWCAVLLQSATHNPAKHAGHRRLARCVMTSQLWRQPLRLLKGSTISSLTETKR